MNAFALFLSLALLAPLAPAQSVDVRPARIGYVSGGAGATFEAFRRGLREAGYLEGRDILIETRFADGKPERFPEMIAELLAQRVDVLVAGSPPGATAALQADTRTPIVIAGVVDPAGLARSLGRPADHVTGTTLASQGLSGRWLELLQHARPGLQRVAVLSNPRHAQRAALESDLAETAPRARVRVRLHDVAEAGALDAALQEIAASDAQALIVAGDPIFLNARDRIVTFAARHKLPAVYFSKLFTDAGGLMAYGGSLEDSYRKAARYLDRILKGARPSQLPMEPTRVDFVVNLQAARALGLQLPTSVLEKATQVME